MFLFGGLLDLVLVTQTLRLFGQKPQGTRCLSRYVQVEWNVGQVVRIVKGESGADKRTSIRILRPLYNELEWLERKPWHYETRRRPRVRVAWDPSGWWKWPPCDGGWLVVGSRPPV